MRTQWAKISELLHGAGFVEEEHILKTLYDENEAFQALCQHYLECNNAVGAWGVSVKQGAQSRWKEYVDIQKELENELHKIIESTVTGYLSGSDK